MDYSCIVGQMTWSHTRLAAFEDCPYKFLLRYILDLPPSEHFFSGYGSLLHSLHEALYKGSSPASLRTRFLAEFFRQVPTWDAPGPKVVRNYFEQGVAYLEQPYIPAGEIVAVEQPVEFFIGGYPFSGVIDLAFRGEDGKLRIADHKSRALKPRSKRKAPTKTDEELDRYLRQLYLYAEAARQLYGETPAELIFNCFRTQTQIVEPFIPAKSAEAMAWAQNIIRAAQQNVNWTPSVEFFKCRYICGMRDVCEYAQLEAA